MEPTSPWAQGSVHTDTETHVLLFLRCCHCVCTWGHLCSLEMPLPTPPGPARPFPGAEGEPLVFQATLCVLWAPGPQGGLAGPHWEIAS